MKLTAIDQFDIECGAIGANLANCIVCKSLPNT